MVHLTIRRKFLRLFGKTVHTRYTDHTRIDKTGKIIGK